MLSAPRPQRHPARGLLPLPSHTPRPDEFGNYIGSDLDSDDSDDSAAEGEAAPADDEMEQDPNPNALAMTSQIQADADEGAASNAIVLHEDKKWGGISTGLGPLVYAPPSRMALLSPHC